MQLPMVTVAPIVEAHAEAFRDLFGDERQFRHFQNYLSGLIVLDDKSLTNISRCLLDSTDKTNLSRFLSLSPWQPTEVNERRVDAMRGGSAIVVEQKKCDWLLGKRAMCMKSEGSLPTTPPQTPVPPLDSTLKRWEK